MNKSTNFEITSGKVRVTDPCYDPDTWCAGVVENVKNGTWVASVTKTDGGSWGERIAQLMVRHVDSGEIPPYATWTKESIDVGVDSGQAGFYDAELYPKTKEEIGKWDGKGGFYDKVCSGHHNTGDDISMMPFGCASDTGYGDGSYNCYTLRDGLGKVIAMKIVFIGNEDEEDALDAAMKD